MYKLAIVVPLFFAAVSAGIIGAPLAHGPIGYGHNLAVGTVALGHAPVAVAHAPVATSYANTYRVVHDSVPVVRTVAHAAPVAVAHAAPIAVAHAAPLAIAGPGLALGHGGLLAHGYHH